MPVTPHRRGGARGSNLETPPSQKQRRGGHFSNGQWWCNCDPRQLAAHLQVRKEGPTKGQWFYRCRARPACGFWMWEDEENSHLRDVNVSAPGHQEQTGGAGRSDREDEDEMPPQKTPSLTQKNLTSYGIQITPRRRGSDAKGEGSSDEDIVPAPKTSTPCPSGRSKRKRDVLEDDDDSFGELDSDIEREMAALADTTEPLINTSAQQKLTNNLETPAAARTAIEGAGGLPTPSTARTLFPEASSSRPSNKSHKRHKSVSFEGIPDETPSKQQSISSTATLTCSTPPPQTMPSSSPSTVDTPSTVAGPDLTEEVMSLLEPCGLDQSVLRSVQSALDAAARRNRGLGMGRDTARAAARDKDARIAKLQERVAALENKERMQSTQLTNLKASLMRVCQDH